MAIKRCALLCWIATLLCPLPGQAIEGPRLNGFATLGAVYNPDDFTFVRGLEQPRGAREGWSSRPDSNLGLQLNWPLNPDWELVLQGVIRHHYDSYRPRATLAFARYQPSQNWTFRAGRVGFDAYIGSDSRQVGYAHLPVRHPIEYFGALELEYLDGADVTYQHPLGNGLLTAKLLFGAADEKRAVGPDLEYDVGGSLSLGGYLLYRIGDWQFRAGAISTELDKELPGTTELQQALLATGDPGLARRAADLPLADSRLTNWSLEAHWTRGPVELQLRVNRRELDSRGLPEGDNLMALFGYRLGDFTPYIGYASSDTRNTGLPATVAKGSELATALRSSNIEQEVALLGVRWDFHPVMAMKMQIDRVHVPDPLGSFYTVGDSGWDGDSTLFSATLEWLF